MIEEEDNYMYASSVELVPCIVALYVNFQLSTSHGVLLPWCFLKHLSFCAGTIREISPKHMNQLMVLCVHCARVCEWPTGIGLHAKNPTSQKQLIRL